MPDAPSSTSSQASSPTRSETRFLQPDVLARITDLELRARSVIEGFVSGMHRSPYQGYSVEFAQHREYVPGDDIRHLDWRVYGKSDRFYIKQYEEETNLRAHIVLDCSQSMRYPEQDLAAGRMTKFEYAATLAACLAYLLIHQQDAVGLLLFDNKVRASLPPLSHATHLRAMLYQINEARLDQPTARQGVFSALAGQLRHRSVAIVISDLLSDQAEVIAGLQRLRHENHEVVVMHILDQDEREFPFVDRTLFEGMEMPDQQVLTDPQSLRHAYLAALERFIGAVRSACTNDQIDYVGLSTADRLDVGLRAYLASRMHRLKARA